MSVLGIVGSFQSSSAETYPKTNPLFAVSILNPPSSSHSLIVCLLSALPGQLIVATAVAVVQTAWYLAVAEAEIARAMDAVALKTRSAGVADT